MNKQFSCILLNAKASVWARHHLRVFGVLRLSLPSLISTEKGQA